MLLMIVSVFFATILIFTSAFESSITPKQITECCEEYCYEEDTYRPQYKNLGIHGPYAFAKGTDTQIYNIPGCSAEKIWMLVRHGTRLPRHDCLSQLEDLEKLRDEIVLRYDNLNLSEKGRLCEADLNLIKNWKWDSNISIQYDEHLTLSGWNEMKELAKDYRNAFPDVIGNAYSSEKFRFSYTDYQRSEASYQAFVEGLFGDGSYNDFTLVRPANPNMILSPTALCEEWRATMIAESGPNSETSKFQNSEIFRKLRSDVSMKLGFFEPEFQSLSVETVLNIYEMCRFEKAWYLDKSSPWCSALTPSQFKILEYNDDIYMYMVTLYGSDINSKISCSAMDEMMNHLETGISPKVVAYFGHTWFIHTHLNAMGAFKDTIPLRGDNFDTMGNRTWKTSEINPFAANLAAVKYNCPNDDVEEKVKVKFFLNQKTLNLDWCDSNGVCKLSDMLDQYGLYRNGDCEEIFCTVGDSLGDRLSSKLVLIFFYSLTLASAILK